MSFDIGIFMVFGIAALFPVGILVGGWASHNKYAMMGGFRAGAQQISYEVPMILAVMGVVMLAGSMKLSTIVESQAGVWNVVTQPFAFILFFICVLAELNRVPFDMPEAESELVSGFNVEYSSMRFALFFVAEYVNVFTLSLLTVLLFLGGWNGPILPDWIWLHLKTYAWSSWSSGCAARCHESASTSSWRSAGRCCFPPRSSTCCSRRSGSSRTCSCWSRSRSSRPSSSSGSIARLGSASRRRCPRRRASAAREVST